MAIPFGGIIVQDPGDGPPGTPTFDFPVANLPIQEDSPAVAIFVGPISDTDALAVYQDMGDPRGIWADYRMESRYSRNNHIGMMPLSTQVGFPPAPPGNPTPTVAFVQTHAPTLTWIVRWTACKTNAKPKIPNPYPPTNSPWILMGQEEVPGTIGVVDGGTVPIYRISGTYVYGHQYPSAQLESDAKFAVPPWMLINAFDRTIGPAPITQNLASPDF